MLYDALGRSASRTDQRKFSLRMRPVHHAFTIAGEQLRSCLSSSVERVGLIVCQENGTKARAGVFGAINSCQQSAVFMALSCEDEDQYTDW